MRRPVCALENDRLTAHGKTSMPLEWVGSLILAHRTQLTTNASMAGALGQ